MYLNKSVEDHVNDYINEYGLSYRFIPQLTEKVKESIELYRENQKLKFLNNRKRFLEEDIERVQDYYSSDLTRRSSYTSSISQIDPIVYNILIVYYLLERKSNSTTFNTS